ncbi:hypothetical protein [Nonomuraea jiangxiensis]|uniref:hypothetical protein n=1 Tax=Nonomuraea jiangxiensis TaxID=633440 RepID=UPI00115F8E3B|nr:hypothetical protein [Nonomuraea jiangxiensis]
MTTPSWPPNAANIVGELWDGRPLDRAVGGGPHPAVRAGGTVTFAGMTAAGAGGFLRSALAR